MGTPYLTRQLLGAQLVHGHNLAGQRLGVQVAVGVQNDLGNHGVVRHHHRDRAEQRLRGVVPQRNQRQDG